MEHVRTNAGIPGPFLFQLNISISKALYNAVASEMLMVGHSLEDMVGPSCTSEKLISKHASR